MALDLVWLILGLGLIVKGGDWFVAAALRIAEFLRMPRVVIGGTLVSLATTTPELVVSIMAGSQGESGLAVGNAVGSCICNIGLILGLTAVLRHIDVHPRALLTPLVALFGFGLALFLMTLDLRLSRVQGAALVAAGALYFLWDFVRHYRDRKPADLREAREIEDELSRSPRRWLASPWGTGGQFIVGALIVVLGSRLLVDGAVSIASRLGVPSIVLGLTVVAIGTSLPELVTAITSSRRAVSDLAVGNVLGANIANLSLIVGSAAMITEVRLDRGTQVLNFPALLLMICLLVFMLVTDRRITRREGGALLVSYSIYLFSVVFLALRQSTG